MKLVKPEVSGHVKLYQPGAAQIIPGYHTAGSPGCKKKNKAGGFNTQSADHP
jgi:hypothetical protein